MKIDKAFYRSFMKDIFADPYQLKFWDGEVVKYGEGQALFHIDFNEPILKSELLSNPTLAFGEGYMQNKIDIKGNVRKVIESLYKNQGSFLNNKGRYVRLARFLFNNLNKSKENIQYHYDIGNDFYRLWLDETMTYSCAYFKSPDEPLAQAQRNKVEHILNKLNLQPGQNLLDIGCGWGELIITAAKKYQVKTLGITLSSEQNAKVKERIKQERLVDLVEVQLIDYREIKGRTFDRVVSIGMLEHVGKEYLLEYFSTVKGLLKDGGVSLLHTITGYIETNVNSWINKYIFPGGYIPSVQELIGHMAAQKFFLIDLESIREHYARTLEHWAINFEKALPQIRQMKDESFIRMWRLYLNGCAASFHCGNADLHQFLFTKGVKNDWPLSRGYMYGVGNH